METVMQCSAYYRHRDSEGRRAGERVEGWGGESERGDGDVEDVYVCVCVCDGMDKKGEGGRVVIPG